MPNEFCSSDLIKTNSEIQEKGDICEKVWPLNSALYLLIPDQEEEVIFPTPKSTNLNLSWSLCQSLCTSVISFFAHINVLQTFWNFGILSQTRAWSFLSGSKDLLLPKVSLVLAPSSDEEAKEEEATDEDLFDIEERSCENGGDQQDWGTSIFKVILWSELSLKVKACLLKSHNLIWSPANLAKFALICKG